MNRPGPAPTRRKFLSLACGSAAFYLAYAASNGKSKPTSNTSFNSFEKTGEALGTSVSMRVLHEQESIARTALEEAFAEIETVERVMSLYRPESQLSQLNREGFLSNPHPYLLDVLNFSQVLSEKSLGAFDVTVQPLWETFLTAARKGELPSASTIEAAKARTGWQHLEISRTQIRFARPGMAITLNGVAQGYAADKALEALRARGIQHALVDSGEFGALGKKPDQQCWQLGIQHPREPGQMISTVALDDCCLSTSGDYETFFSPDFAENHIFDPRTGHSPRTLASVSVLAPNGLWADGLSTALCVMGEEAGTTLLAQYANTQACFVDKKMKTSTTRGFPAV